MGYAHHTQVADIDAGFLYAAAAACGWPRAHVGTFSFMGETGWRHVAGRATPRERAVALGALANPLLLVTACGRRRTRSWLDGRPSVVAESVTERAARIARSLAFFGDEQVLPVVARALACAPRCVGDFVVREAMVIVSGRTTGGWTCGRLPDRYPIVISGSEADAGLAFIALHEAAHSFQIDYERAATAVEVAALRTWPAESRPPRSVRCANEEFLADASALSWLLRGESA